MAAECTVCGEVFTTYLPGLAGNASVNIRAGWHVSKEHPDKMESQPLTDLVRFP